MFNTDTIRITPEFLNFIAGIDEFKGAWRTLGTLAPERLSSLRHVATIESIGSSTRIEGSGLSDRDVERLLANLEITSLASRDEQEVAGYAEVTRVVFDSWSTIPISENHVRQLHRDLLIHSEKDAWHRGNYKTSLNRVAAFDDTGREIAVVFDPATPFDTPRLMGELVDWVNREREARTLHPLLIIGVFVGRVPRISSIPGRQWAPESHSDHSAPVAGRLQLRALELTRARHRAKRARILRRFARDLGHHPRRISLLATVARILPRITLPADAAAQRQGGA